MDAQYALLADRALASHRTLNASNHGSRLLIALAGPPGSGKTTLARHVAALINYRHTEVPQFAAVASMDGFHHPRSYLDSLSNKEEAYARRGAPWTFDAGAIVAFIGRCRGAEGTLEGPTFDHALKDPVEGGLRIGKETRVVIFEGNYLLVDEEPWSQVRALVDETWLVTVDGEEARLRVAKRHVEAGIEMDMEAALRRVDENDALNGKYIMRHSAEATVTVESIGAKGQ